MWELVTRGAVPYADIDNWEVPNFVQSGKRLQQPLYCPDSVLVAPIDRLSPSPHLSVSPKGDR